MVAVDCKTRLRVCKIQEPHRTQLKDCGGRGRGFNRLVAVEICYAGQPYPRDTGVKAENSRRSSSTWLGGIAWNGDRFNDQLQTEMSIRYVIAL